MQTSRDGLRAWMAPSTVLGNLGVNGLCLDGSGGTPCLAMDLCVHDCTSTHTTIMLERGSREKSE